MGMEDVEMSNTKPRCTNKSCARCSYCEIGIQGYGRRCEKFGISAITESVLFKAVQQYKSGKVIKVSEVSKTKTSEPIDALPSVRDSMEVGKEYVVAYYNDDVVTAVRLPLYSVTDSVVSFKCGSGWLNLPKGLILGISDSAEHISKFKSGRYEKIDRAVAREKLSELRDAEKWYKKCAKKGTLRFTLIVAI